MTCPVPEERKSITIQQELYSFKNTAPFCRCNHDCLTHSLSYWIFKTFRKGGIFNLHNHLVLHAESTEANDPRVASSQRLQVKFLKKARMTSFSTMQNEALSEDLNEDFFSGPSSHRNGAYMSWSLKSCTRTLETTHVSFSISNLVDLESCNGSFDNQQHFKLSACFIYHKLMILWHFSKSLLWNWYRTKAKLTHPKGVVLPSPGHMDQGVTVLPANLRNELLPNTTTGSTPNEAHHLICSSSSFQAVTFRCCQVASATHRTGMAFFYICLL